MKTVRKMYRVRRGDRWLLKPRGYSQKWTDKAANAHLYIARACAEDHVTEGCVLEEVKVTIETTAEIPAATCMARAGARAAKRKAEHEARIAALRLRGQR